MSEENVITKETRNRVFLIGLNRPQKRNAFNLQMLKELAEALQQYEKDPDLWCAVLFAHGEHFTAGLDLAEVGPAVVSGKPLFPEGLQDPLNLKPPYRTKPLICAVSGWCDWCS